MKKYLIILIAFVSFSPHFAHADITTGLVDWWTMDDGSGLIAQDSGSNNINMSLTGTPPPSWVSPGKIGASSLQFDGSQNYLQHAGSTGAGNNFTMSAWVKKTGAGSNEPRAIFMGSGDNYMDICFSGSPTFSFSPSISGQTLIGTGSCAATGDWHMYTATWNGSTNVATMYYDGVSIASDSTKLGTINYTSVIIAQYPGGGLFLNGIVDDARVYNRALTSSDVAQLYAYPPITVRMSRFIVRAQRFLVRIGRKFIVY